jgi:hypothetical protein
VVIVIEIEVPKNEILKNEQAIARHGWNIAKTIMDEYPSSVKEVRVLRVDS